MSYESVNPFTGERTGSYPAHSMEEASRIIQIAEKSFHSWKDFSFEKRAALFTRLAGMLEERKEELAEIITSEMGKLRRESIAEIEKCAWVCRFYAGSAERFLSSEPREIEGKSAFVKFEPMGVILGIFPWNFPFWQVFRFAAPTLMAGNTAVIKHASNVPGSAVAIQQLFADSGFPEGVFRNFFPEHADMDGIIGNPLVKAVTLTGSNKAGAVVASLAGKHIKKAVLELGGSDPFIVLNDAALDKAVETGIKSRFQNCGQSCIAAKRFILQSEIADIFLEKLISGVRSISPGDPMEEATGIAPMARKDLRDELHGQVEKSRQMGAEILIGGNIIHGGGNGYEPTVITGIKKGMPAYDEEIFGPVALVFVVDTVEEAVELANDTPFGLGASIWTQDKKKGMEIASHIRSGSVFINDMVKSDPRLPFGGIKESGFGRELSEFGIREFVNIKTVVQV